MNMSSNNRLLAVAAGLAFWTGAAMAQTTPPVSGPPPQGWVSKSGRMNLSPQGKADVMPDALARSQVEETMGRYGIAIDEGLEPVLNSLFTEDAKVDIVHGSTGPGKVPVSFTGRGPVVANFVSAWRQQADQRRHFVSNVVFERLAATQASVIAFGNVVVLKNGIIPGATVVYTADLRREDGVWRMSRLLIAIDDYAGAPPK